MLIGICFCQISLLRFLSWNFNPPWSSLNTVKNCLRENPHVSYGRKESCVPQGGNVCLPGFAVAMDTDYCHVVCICSSSAMLLNQCFSFKNSSCSTFTITTRNCVVNCKLPFYFSLSSGLRSSSFIIFKSSFVHFSIGYFTNKVS